MVRKKYDDAATQFEAALAGFARTGNVVRLASAYNLAKKPDQALATLDKLNATPDLHPSIKAVAAQERNNAVKLKGRRELRPPPSRQHPKPPRRDDASARAKRHARPAK